MNRLNFTSALYLGMQHPNNQLIPWKKLTTGVPAILQESSIVHQVAQRVANLQGYQNGLAYTSTLHLFWDVFDYLSKGNIAIFIDREAYPIAKWGAERAVLKGIPVVGFSSRHLSRLNEKIRQMSKARKRPILLTDGWNTMYGKSAPIYDYLKIIEPHNGLLVLDDTQSLGLLGTQPNRQQPLGKRGGGILPWLDLKHSNILVGSSLAKGFGVPIAILSGNSDLLVKIRQQSNIRLHTSPPSNVTALAGLNALHLNQKKGDFLRRLLWRNIQLFRKGMRQVNLKTIGSLFPVQTISNIQGKMAIQLQRFLAIRGIKAILVKGRNNLPLVSFLFSAVHTKSAIKVLIRAIHNFKKLFLTTSKKYQYDFF